MEKINWTDKQLEAIETEGKNILVSAAAGSGKTAVLVERVIRKLTRDVDPVDLDSLIIMTFTRAAASQMKTKIYNALCEAIKENPGNDHLRRQLRKVGSARICTIDALCMDIVRENFHALNVDPGFQLADEGGLDELKAEVLSEILEEAYVEASPDFMQFSSFYVDKNEDAIADLINDLYRFSQSHPEPERWIRESMDAYIKAGDLANGTADPQPWMQIFASLANGKIYMMERMAKEGLAIAYAPNGPYKYADNLEMIVAKCEEALQPDCFFDKKKEILEEMDAAWVPGVTIKKTDDVDPDLKERGHAICSAIGTASGMVKELLKGFFSKNLDEHLRDMSSLAGVATVIRDLTLKYCEKLKEARHEMKTEEFNSVAHLALEALLEKGEDGYFLKEYERAGQADADQDPGRNAAGSFKYVYTSAADELAQGISEIIVDEYQDTNELQDCLIGALSGERFGRPNVFMVGDVKQSIYGFRMACPELFNEKFKSYPNMPQTCHRILLNSNFRSRHQVVDFVNAVFNAAMIDEVGGIDYQNGHQLIFGAKESYPEFDEMMEVDGATVENASGAEGNPEGRVSIGLFTPEIYFTGNGKAADKEGEAYIIARRIEELVGTSCVTDSETKTLRPAKYGDIAILTRKNDNPEIEKMLEAKGIPYVKSSGNGLLESFEIKLAVNFLKIIDNPYQDIPFAAVLTSPIYNVSANDLARLKNKSFKNRPFSLYEACMTYKKCSKTETCEKADDCSKVQGFEKIEKCRSELAELRNLVGRASASEILGKVLERRICQIVSAMDQGESRLTNLEILRRLARESDETSFGGLHAFLEMLKQRESGQKLSGAATAAGDAVQLMTMHKSKGLEFPICFVSSTGNGWPPENDKILKNRQLGTGLDLRDITERTKSDTLLRMTINEIAEVDKRAESLRLLYVAMTRAKEKLIITGSTGNLNSALSSAAEAYCSETGVLPDGRPKLPTLRERAVLKFKHHLEVVMDALESRKEEFVGSNPLCYYNVYPDRLVIEEDRADAVAGDYDKKNELNELIEGANADPGVSNALSDVYPFENASKMSVKTTASQLENPDGGNYSYKTMKAHWDDFGNEVTTLRGSERGNAYHKFFELFDYGAVRQAFCQQNPETGTEDFLSEKQDSGAICQAFCQQNLDLGTEDFSAEKKVCGDNQGTALKGVSGKFGGEEIHNSNGQLMSVIAKMLEDCVDSGKMTAEYASAIETEKMATFAASDIGQRMAAADQAGTLRREQQFVMTEEKEDETVLVQGIIDAFFIEDGAAVLVDYKTDRGKDASALVETYKGQQDAYARAITKALGVPVKEKILYSVELGEAVHIN